MLLLWTERDPGMFTFEEIERQKAAILSRVSRWAAERLVFRPSDGEWRSRRVRRYAQKECQSRIASTNLWQGSAWIEDQPGLERIAFLLDHTSQCTDARDMPR
jgi:hypothetical protein